MHRSHKARDRGRAECTQLKQVIYLPNSLRGQQKKKKKKKKQLSHKQLVGKKVAVPLLFSLHP